MTNEMLVSVKINETAGDIARINAFSEKLRHLADYLEKHNTLPDVGYYDNTAYQIKELVK
jgi:hypothetical protein